jgi:hypothetical protein
VAMGLTQPLAMGGPTSVFTIQLGSLGWVSEFSKVRAQVDLGLTMVDYLTGY